MLDALVAGTTDPAVLADLARQLRRKIPVLQEALQGRFGSELQTGEIYADPGGDYFAGRDPEKPTKRLIAQLERLGHTVHAAGGHTSTNETFPFRPTHFRNIALALTSRVGGDAGDPARATRAGVGEYIPTLAARYAEPGRCA